MKINIERLENLIGRIVLRIFLFISLSVVFTILVHFAWNESMATSYSEITFLETFLIGTAYLLLGKTTLWLLAKEKNDLS